MTETARRELEPRSRRMLELWIGFGIAIYSLKFTKLKKLLNPTRGEAHETA